MPDPFVSNSSVPIFKFETMQQSQGRTFGPLLGLFLLNLFARTLANKFDPFANSLLYNYKPQWYPIESVGSYLTTQSAHVTTEIPYISNYGYETNYPEDYHTITPNPNNIEDLIPAESNPNGRRQLPQNYRRRNPGNRYSQKRRRTTAPPFDYYSYEDYSYNTERNRPNRRPRPPPNRYQSAESYEDDSKEDYYDSVEVTTKYKKQKKRPTRKGDKNRLQEGTTENAFQGPTSSFNPQTEIVIVRQATTPTTTEPSTMITNGTTTTPSSNTTSNTTAYGYGPSNGNEGISFTYGPPVAKYQYTIPYVDWYAQEATRNAIVKRVRDIVTFDKNLNLK